MTVYVDPLMDHGWILRGHEVKSCHMFSDRLLELGELHEIAERIGCKRAWFHEKGALPHYDLTVVRRQEAIGCGVIAVTRREAVEIWKKRREAIDSLRTRGGSRRCGECPCLTYCARLMHCAKVAP